MGKGGCGTRYRERLTYETADKNRECQDIAWTLIFLGFCVGVAYIGYVAHETGDPRVLAAGTDSFGNICGISDNSKRDNNTNRGLDMGDYKYTYYTRPTDGLRTFVMCVKSCPSEARDVDEIEDILSVSGIIFCDVNEKECISSGGCLSVPYTLSEDVRTEYELNENGCPLYVYASEAETFSKRCVPSIPEISDQAKSIMAGYHNVSQALGLLEILVHELDETQNRIIALVGLAVVSSFVFVVSMRCCAGPIVYLSVAACVTASLALTGYLGYRFYNEYENYYGKPEYERENAELRNLQITGGLFGGVFVGCGIFVCLICAMRKKIYSAVQLYEEAAEAVCEMPTIFCIPFCSVFFILAWLAGWMYIMLYLATSEGFYRDENHQITTELSEEMQIKLAYMVLAFFWLIQMIVAMEEFIVASTIVIWYLQHGHTDGFPLMESIWRLFRYHFGSLALGSLIIALIQFGRTILEYIEYKSKDEIGDNKCIKFMFKCLACLLFIFERCMKFLNKNAYIEIAIWGDSFCVSCGRALSLLLDNITLTATVNGVGFLLAIIIKICVTAGVGVVAFYWFETQDQDGEDLVLSSFIGLLTMVVAYFVADSFTDTFEMAGETMLFCWLEDYATNRDPGEQMVGPEDLIETMLRLHGEKPRSKYEEVRQGKRNRRSDDRGRDDRRRDDYDDDDRYDRSRASRV
eukprot:m.308853 g.308853  ORF g.308853 m.308853 type:complete len:692 (+) comp16473_c0_seq23:194-2269(+)